MKNKVTIDGIECSLGNTAVFESGEAYIINNKPYLAKDCVYDYALKIYKSKDCDLSNLTKGYVGIDEKGGFIEGYFSKSLNNCVVRGDRRNNQVLSEDLLNDDYIQTNDNTYQLVQKTNIYDVYEKYRISRDFKTSFPYGAADVMDAYLEYFKGVQMKVSSNAKRAHDILGGLSVGVEFETDSGLLSKKDCLMNGLIPLRDGSIGGLEYVTIPIDSAKGIQGLFNSLLTLKSKTSIATNCALHYHFGNVPRTKEFIVAFWIVSTLIQEQLYKYQSAYKKDNRGYKTKDYSKPLPNLLRYFEKDLSNKEHLHRAYSEIIYYLGMGLFTRTNAPELKDIHNHPADPNGHQKWHVKPRYSIINLVPLIFCNKKTVEFRHHDVTLNENIVVNEMIINASIINYTIENMESILKGNIDLNDITIKGILARYLSGSELDRIYEFLDVKRNIVCNDFKQGVLFSDTTNMNMRGVCKVTKTETSFNNVEDIAFARKHKDNNYLRIGGLSVNPFNRGRFEQFADIRPVEHPVQNEVREFEPMLLKTLINVRQGHSNDINAVGKYYVNDGVITSPQASTLLNDILSWKFSTIGQTIITQRTIADILLEYANFEGFSEDDHTKFNKLMVVCNQAKPKAVLKHFTVLAAYLAINEPSFVNFINEQLENVYTKDLHNVFVKKEAVTFSISNEQGSFFQYMSGNGMKTLSLNKFTLNDRAYSFSVSNETSTGRFMSEMLFKYLFSRAYLQIDIANANKITMLSNLRDYILNNLHEGPLSRTYVNCFELYNDILLYNSMEGYNSLFSNAYNSAHIAYYFINPKSL